MKIKVPEAGTIAVRRLTVCSIVTFKATDGGLIDYRIEDAVPGERGGTYGIVKEAIARYERDDPEHSVDWEVYTRVPIGKVRVTRHRYRVVSDGYGGSDTTSGTYTRATVQILRGYSESLGECVMRTIQETGPGEDFGTLDCYSANDEHWHTVPAIDLSTDRPEIDRRYGQPHVAHYISFSDGEILDQLDQLAEEFRSAGASW